MPLTLHGNFAEISAGYLNYFNLQLKLFLQTVYVVFSNYLIGGSVQFNLIAYCAQCNAYFVHKKTNLCVFLHPCTH